VIYALTAQSARAAEERVVRELEVPLAELMLRAGTAVAREVDRRAPHGSVVVVAGKGNNGGDGWVAARELLRSRREVRVCTPVAPEELGNVAGDAAREAIGAGVPFSVNSSAVETDAFRGEAVVIDALFGIGVSGSVRQPALSWLEAINASGATVCAVDVPSGVGADSGRSDEHAVRADFTVTFTSPKTGLLLHPGAGLAGEIVVADIGIPWEMAGGPGDLELWSASDYAATVPVLRPDVHKNEQGRVLVVAGSGSFPGAAALVAQGAQRMGAGYVTVAAPESIASVLQTKLTSAVVLGLPENPSRTLASRVAEEILDIAREYDAVVVGPGLTVAHGAVLVVRKLVSELPVPLVLDADGLNALVDGSLALTAREAPTVITPHPGELARLLDATSAEVQADRLSYGARLTGPRLACVLKGAHTVTSGRGRQVINISGGPALATAGTGDVLAGMVGALLAQGLEPLEAGALGAYLHGRAGDHAASELSARCVIAEDVLLYISRAVRELTGE
jgi:NAD(P)H-hydrate epimerase